MLYPHLINKWVIAALRRDRATVCAVASIAIAVVPFFAVLADKPVVGESNGVANRSSLPNRATSSGTNSLAQALAGIQTDQLMRHVNTLADDTLEGRAAGSRGGRAAANYLVSELRQIGVTPLGDNGTFAQDFRQSMRNILAVVEGSDPILKSEALVIGAHYDHVGYGTQKNSFGPLGLIHNGADDNASGTAGLLELAKALQSLRVKPRRSIVIAFWDGEEDGLHGSKHWMEHPTWPRNKIVGNINIDMIGRLGDATTGRKNVEVHGSRSATGFRQWFSEVNSRAQLPLEFPWKLQEDSDHWEFYRRGIPTVMLHTGLHKEYHRPSDDTHLINQKGLTEVTRLILELAVSWANKEEPFVFREKSRTESEPHQVAFESKSRPTPRLGLRWQAVARPTTELVVEGVVAGSPAHKAGLRQGDRLQTVDGEPVEGDAHMKARVGSAERTIDIGFLRGGVSQTARVTLDGKPVRWGFTWRFDDAEPSCLYVTTVVSGSPADQAEIKAGDRIHIPSDDPPRTAGEWNHYLSQNARELEVVVERSGQATQKTLVRSE
jgi:hypothetical protein